MAVSRLLLQYILFALKSLLAVCQSGGNSGPVINHLVDQAQQTFSGHRTALDQPGCKMNRTYSCLGPLPICRSLAGQPPARASTLNLFRHGQLGVARSFCQYQNKLCAAAAQTARGQSPLDCIFFTSVISCSGPFISHIQIIRRLGLK